MNSSKAQDLRDRLMRNFNTAALQRDEREPLYGGAAARLARGTAAAKLGITIDIVDPGKRSCPYHYHYAQEEAFVILEGEGTLRVAGEMLPLVAGDTIFVPAGPDYPHQIINTSAAPLKYLSISTRESPEVCFYPDSDKYLAMARGTLGGEPHEFGRMHRSSDDLDYWDGEP